MASRGINIVIDGDASGFKRAAGDATGSAKGLDKSLRNSAVGGAVAGVAMASVSKALDLVTDFLGDSAAAAKEDTASQDRLALALENTGVAQSLSTAQIEKAIAANQAKGVSDSEQRAGISDFLDKTKSATDAMALNTATIELAAAKGIAYADAEKMIISASAGKTAGLKKAGVEIEKGASITEIATAVNDKFGGSLDKVAGTEKGKMAIASEKMGEAQEKVGAIMNKIALVVLPVLADGLTWVAKNVIPPLMQAFKVMGPVIGGVFFVLGKAVQGWVAILRGLWEVGSRIVSLIVGAFQGMVSTVKGAINAVIGGINSIHWQGIPNPLGGYFAGFAGFHIPYLHSGGIVPGAAGANVLTMLQAGERVTPAGGGGGQTIIVNIASFIGSDQDIDRFTDRIALRLRLAGVG